MIDTTKLYRDMANGSPELKAGVVHCARCGRQEIVDSARCLRTGWPKCCGETMGLGTGKPSSPQPAGDAGTRGGA